MTATDELRRLLDERGVEWMPSVWSARDETFYKVGNTGFLATEMSGGKMKVCIEGYVVPAQAVEATLGRGECRMAHRVFDGDVDVWKCLECGMYCSVTQDAEGGQHVPRYCPNCGRKVVDA